MKKVLSNVQIFERIVEFFDAQAQRPERYATVPGAFSRSSPLNFNRTAVFLLQQSKKSLGIELEEFFDRLGEDRSCPTKSAFSQARYKLDWRFFEDCNQELLRQTTEHMRGLERLGKLRVFAIDGSTLYLINNDSMRAHFGVQTNGKVDIPMARVMCCYDVLNGFCNLAKVDPIQTDELSVALEWVNRLPSNALGVHDRGHASFALMWQYMQQSKHFLIRCRLDFNTQVKAFARSNKRSQEVTLKATNTALDRTKPWEDPIAADATIRVRLVKITLSTGHKEVLITSLPKRKYSNKRLGQVYFWRWKVETFFDRIKNKLQAECFCGHKSLAVFQEFHAAIFLANLHQLLVQYSRKIVDQISEQRQLQYQINYNITLGLMRQKIVLLLLFDGLRATLEDLAAQFVRYLEPRRPDRSYPRIVKAKRAKGKYQTFSNYRRAI